MHLTLQFIIDTLKVITFGCLIYTNIVIGYLALVLDYTLQEHHKKQSYVVIIYPRHATSLPMLSSSSMSLMVNCLSTDVNLSVIFLKYITLL